MKVLCNVLRIVNFLLMEVIIMVHIIGFVMTGKHVEALIED